MAMEPTPSELEDAKAAEKILLRKGIERFRKLDRERELKKMYFNKAESDEERDRRFFAPEIIIPSRYTENRNVSFENTTGEDIIHETSREGKWMLFFDRYNVDEVTGLTALDEAWQKITRMGDFKTTGIMNALCTTALTEEDTLDGVICCFTPDYTDKRQVRKAACAIRNLVYYPKNLFYKTDKATFLGKYKEKGHKNISIYKFTLNGGFYERNEEDHSWYPIRLTDFGNS